MKKKKVLTPLNTNLKSVTLDKSKKDGSVNLKSPMEPIERNKNIFKSSGSTIFKINFSIINGYIKNKPDDVEEIGANEQSSDNEDLL